MPHLVESYIILFFMICYFYFMLYCYIDIKGDSCSQDCERSLTRPLGLDCHDCIQARTYLERLGGQIWGGPTRLDLPLPPQSSLRDFGPASLREVPADASHEKCSYHAPIQRPCPPSTHSQENGIIGSLLFRWQHSVLLGMRPVLVPLFLSPPHSTHYF